ncbi:MAG TPA: FecR domain-containing protein [Candidatus Aminicenantes bacterium]|nr:FecR domain-containing protein [Candidatus Aminicenantes bacterium]HRY65085.1 FecR domain-containing protein [Candidatus Aminicenantes bacterium]HRZ71998.1 FecR domain-containing protein [Candidatus Aminicenantes bacterium]
MKNGRVCGVFFALLWLVAAAGLTAADHYRVLNGPKDLYFGHISYIDPAPGGADPSVLRQAAAGPEPGGLNVPIGPGDTVRTSPGRRCEIQFDSGTIVRLDYDTEVKVETILARSLSSLEELSVLSLARGRLYVMYKQYGRQEMFQVLTSNAAVKLKHNSVALVSAAPDGTTEAQVRYGRAGLLFGPSADSLQDRTVRKGQRLIVLADHQSELAAALEESAFETWNKDVNARFEELHEGLTALPKPIQKLPPAVFYFAQAYGNRYGQWIWDDLYGYVWSPYIDNGRYPWGWSPYYYGRWSYAAGQMFWVPEEPWGWVPYHLGVWQWDKKRGWFWVPGSTFAPAWVAWDFYFGYACWRPWGLFDWFDDPYMYGSDPAWMTSFRYFGGAWNYDWLLGRAGGTTVPNRTVIRREALKQPAPGSLPVPAELKGVVKKVAAAYKAGDPRIRESAAAVPGQLVFVARKDLAAGAVQEKALRWDQVPKAGAPAAGAAAPARRLADPRREAGLIFRGAGRETGPARPKALPAAPRVRGGAAAAAAQAPARVPAVRAAAPAPARFRDWNPDIRVARELGVRIEYSSFRNEVRCPELRITSRDRDRISGPSARLTPHGVVASAPVSASGGGSGVSGSGASSSTASAGSARGGAERTTSSSGNQGSRGSEGGGKVKN